MTILKFFDPTQEPYGVFSNIAEIPCEVRGQRYPNVQKAVYSILLKDYPNNILRVGNHYDLHQNFIYYKTQKYLHDLYIATQNAYFARLKSDPIKIDSSQRFIYYAPDLLVDQKSKYIIGQDPHKYGYNMVGQVLQKIYHQSFIEDDNFKIAVFLAYRACNFILSALKSGNSIAKYRGLLPIQILQELDQTIDYPKSNIDDIFEQYKNRTLSHYHYVQQEMMYPRSLVFFILKREAPYINFYVHEAIMNKLFYHSCAHIITTEYEIAPKFVMNVFRDQQSKLTFTKSDSFKDRLINLFATNRLPLKPSVLQEVKNLIQNRIDDKDVKTAINFIPLNIIPEFPGKGPDSYTLVLTDSSEQSLSPTTACKFVLDGFTFYTIIHAIYFHMFATILPKKKAYSLLLLRSVKKPEMKDFHPVLTTNFDDMYDKLLTNYTIDILREALLYKFEKNPLLQQLLLKTEKQGITEFIYSDSSDPILGFNPEMKVLYGNSMNQTGKIILEIRSILNPELRQEYSFFWDRVGDNIYLHAWLKKRMMDLRLSLSWFKQISPLTMKNVKLFFSKFYTPYHTIYRFENLDSEKPEPFFNAFFSSLEMSEDVVQYISDHFNAMFIGILKDSEESLEKLYDKIKTHVEVNQPLTIEQSDIILKKTLVLLQYLPKKYNKSTLSLYLTLIQGSDTLLKIPDKTFVIFNENNPTYMYMSKNFLTILQSTAGLTDANIGDLGYIATYLHKNLSLERFRFFFQ